LLLILTLWNKITGWFIKTTLELSSINYLSSSFLIVSIIIISSAAGFTPLLSFFMKFSLFSIISINYGMIISLMVGLLNIIGSVAYLKMLWNMIGYNLISYQNWKKLKPYANLTLYINYRMAWFTNILCLVICLGFFLYNEIIYNFCYVNRPIFVDSDINSALDYWIRVLFKEEIVFFNYIDPTNVY
jgi:hypothetical protein